MIDRIHIFGLRCSGTNWLCELLTSNYPHLEVQEGGPGWKHMWNIEDNMNPENCPELLQKNILFIFLSRNVVDWISSFSLQPHHCPWAEGIGVSALLRKTPFISYSEDNQIIQSSTSILEERSRTYRYILELQKFIPHCLLLNYDDVCNDLEFLQQTLAKFEVYMDPFSDPTISKNNIKPISYYKKEQSAKFIRKTYNPLTMDDKKYILDNLDWGTEVAWGHQKIKLAS